jgi:hypothetical protein
MLLIVPFTSLDFAQPDGTYCPAQSVTPTNCSIGSYTNNLTSHASCMPCEEGTYQHGPGASSCQQCEPGHWCSSGQLFPCGFNTYSNMNLSVRTTQADCLLCMANAQTNASGAISIAACMCVENFYRDTVFSRMCNTCPIGANCMKGTLTSTLKIQAGYWRISNESADVRPCPVNQTCRGSAEGAVGYCNTGIDEHVPYCSRCIEYPEKYLDISDSTCKPCSGSQYALLIYISVIMLIVLTALLMPRVMSSTWLVQLQAIKQFVRLIALRASLLAKGKQLLAFYQIVSHFHEVFGVTLPPHFRALERHFDIFNVNVFALPGLRMQCFGLHSFTSQLLLRAGVPLMLVLGSVGYYSWRQKLREALPFTLWVTFLTFSLVSSPAFQAFNCESFDGGRSYLRADYSLCCFDGNDEPPAYPQLKVVATLVIVIYPIGVPVLYTWLLVTSSHAPSKSNGLSFLTENYRLPYYWWELPEVARRLLLASFFALPFMGHGTLMQLFAALTVQLGFLVVQSYAAPFKRPTDNFFALAINVILILAIFCCAILEQDELVEATEDRMSASMQHRFRIPAELIAYLLFFSMLLVLALLVCILLHNLAYLRRQPLLRWRSDCMVAELPWTDGWHALISHVWGTGQE